MDFNKLLIFLSLTGIVMYLVNKRKVNQILKLNMELKNERKKIQEVFFNIEDGIIITDLLGNVTYVNPIIKKVLDNEGKEVTDISYDEILSIIKEKIYSTSHCCSHKGMKEEESCNDHIGNDTYSCFNTKVSSIKNKDGHVIEKITIIPSMRECDEAHQLIHKMAHYDLLTGLANRALINKNLEEKLIEAKNYDTKLAVAFIDLDNFKLINDTMGHDVGDLVLKKAGKIIQDNLESGDVAGRFGGDEFIIVMSDIKKKKDALRKINNMIELLSKPVNIKGKEIYIPASVGISFYPYDGTSKETLIKNADIAMYSAKGMGKNTCRLYSEEMNVQSTEKLKMINDLKNGLKNNEFIVYYQPQIDINTNEVTGMEALIRWQHPEKGLVPPLDFIPLAEETGLIIPMGEWVLREACRQNKAWQDLGYRPMRMAVNLSIAQFEHESLLPTVKRILAETGLNPKWLELEITESLAVKCFDCAVKKIKQLKELGIYISLDDFGTGYSSYNHLNQLPIDSLKIDKIFFDNLKKNSDEEFITKTMISLAKRLNLKVIAEGIETTSQLNFLRKQKCNIAQGFLFSKPVPAQEFLSLIRKTPA